MVFQKLLSIGGLGNFAPASGSFTKKGNLYFSEDQLESSKLKRTSRRSEVVVIEAKNLNILWGDDPEIWEFVTDKFAFEGQARLKVKPEILECLALTERNPVIPTKKKNLVAASDPRKTRILTSRRSAEVAHLKGTHSFVVCGDIHECELTIGKCYRVSFIVKGIKGTRTDSNVTLMIQTPGKGWLASDENIPMDGQWTELRSQKIRVWGSSSKLRFYMVNTNNTEKRDLYVGCAIIQRA